MRTTIMAGILVLVLGVATNASATAISYSYTGNNFNFLMPDATSSTTFTTAMSVSGSFHLDSTFDTASLTDEDITTDVSSFSFFNGITTLTEANTDFSKFIVSTNALGNIIGWNIFVSQNISLVPGDISFAISTSSPCNSPSSLTICDSTFSDQGNADGSSTLFDFASVDTIGVWTGPTGAVPEPTTLALMSLGLAGVGFSRRKAR